MTLRELINSVDSEQYSESALYQKLRDTKPEYGTSRRIQVKLVNGEVTITNAHVGSLGDILTYQIDVAPDLQVTKMQYWTKSSKRWLQTPSAMKSRLSSGMILITCKKQRLFDD